MATISIIIPYKNANQTLGKTLESLCAQSFSDWEAWIIDDHSEQAPQTMVDQLSDARVHLVRNQGKGVADARNYGVSLSESEFIAFLDADDIWYKHKLKTQLTWLLARPDLDLVFCRCRFIDQSDTPTGVYSSKNIHKLAPKNWLAENPSVTSSTLFLRRSLWEKVGPLKSGMQFSEDQEWLIRAAFKHAHIEGINQVLVDYRLSQRGLSSNCQAMLEGWEYLFQQVELHSPEVANQFGRWAKSIYLRHLARHCQHLHRPAHESIYWIGQSLKTNPFLIFQQPRRTLGTLTKAIWDSVYQAFEV